MISKAHLEVGHLLHLLSIFSYMIIMYIRKVIQSYLKNIVLANVLLNQ